MKRSFALSFFILLAWTVPAVTQETNPKPAPDPYKATLDRLESLSTTEIPDWKFHNDVPHPEDPHLNDSDWQVVKPHEEWETGPRVLRRWIEIPDKLNGYATSGS